MDYNIARNIGGNSYLVKVYYKLYCQMLIDLVLVMSVFSKESLHVIIIQCKMNNEVHNLIIEIYEVDMQCLSLVECRMAIAIIVMIYSTVYLFEFT